MSRIKYVPNEGRGNSWSVVHEEDEEPEERGLSWVHEPWVGRALWGATLIAFTGCAAATAMGVLGIYTTLGHATVTFTVH